MEEIRDKIGKTICGEIMAQCGDLPVPYGYTSFGIQAEWSKLLMQNREALVQKFLRWLTSRELDANDICDTELKTQAFEMVKEALDILKESKKSVFARGGSEFQTWLRT